MADEKRARGPQLQGRPAVVAIVLVVIALVAGTGWGWAYAGPIGGLLGILLGTAAGTLAFTIVRAVSSAARFAERPAPDVRTLPPDQAVQVLAAMLGAKAGDERGAPAIGAGLIGEIAKAKARADGGDVDGAVAKLRALAEDNPHSPAVPAALVQVLAGSPDRADERRMAAATAIGLALRGGMNRLAVQVYEQLEPAARTQLRLDERQQAQLERALAAQAGPRDPALKS